jgi:DNA sulfur modification protein DndB
VLRALGGLGVDLLESSDWPEHLAPLAHIDWSKKNPEWENICIVANSVVSNRQARAATKAFIKAKLGLKLTDGEQRSMQRAEASAEPRTEAEQPSVQVKSSGLVRVHRVASTSAWSK